MSAASGAAGSSADAGNGPSGVVGPGRRFGDLLDDPDGARQVVVESQLVGAAQRGLLEGGDGLAGVAVQQVEHADAVPAPGRLGVCRGFCGVGEPLETLPRRLGVARGQRRARVGEQGTVAHPRLAGVVDGRAVPRRRLADFAVGHVDVADADARLRRVRIGFQQTRVQPPGGLHLPGVQGGSGHGYDRRLDALDAQPRGVRPHAGAGAEQAGRSHRREAAPEQVPFAALGCVTTGRHEASGPSLGSCRFPTMVRSTVTP